mgnify:CR=1 FL=1
MILYMMDCTNDIVYDGFVLMLLYMMDCTNDIVYDGLY